MNLPDEKREAVAEVLCRWWDDPQHGDDPGHWGGVRPCDHCRREADALAPLLAGWLAEARGEAEATHRDLTRRLGFGDNITEPQADNDTIVAWFEERELEANEWVESQLWRNDCYAKGHADDEDCFECDPAFAYERGLAEGEARVRARVEALHFRRAHTASGGQRADRSFDFVAHGQSEFPDLCDHCRTRWPCATAAALDADAADSTWEGA